jgi:hypothetical protein
VLLFQLVILRTFVVRMFRKLVFAFLAALPLLGLAQGGAKSENPDEKLAGLYKEPYDRKKEIRYDGKKYRIYNNYVTLGVGKGYNSLWNDGWTYTAVDFNFHLSKTYYQAGGYVAGPSFYNKEQVQLHLGAGYRKESYNYFWAVFGGLGYTNGFYPVQLKDMAGKDSAKIYPIMSLPGFHFAAQAFYKLKFDYGIGLTIFADVNSKQYNVGARIELFFSGAYRGTIRHKEED